MMQRSRIFPILLFGLLTVVGVGLFEGFVRLIGDHGKQYHLEMWKYARDLKQKADDPELSHVHRPKQSRRLMAVDVTTNSIGLRDREFSESKDKGTKRILMLGDSLTLGWGVPAEETFAKRLEQIYAAQGLRVEVINSGVGNYNTAQEVAYFLSEGRKLKPDVVVLNYFINDAELTPKFRPPSWFERICYSCIYVGGATDTIVRLFDSKNNWENYYLSLYEKAGWPRVVASLQKLADHCQREGIRLVIANLPELHDLNNYKFGKITELLREQAQRNSAEFVDLLPYLQRQKADQLWVSVQDPHPNALAHKLIAEGLFDYLELRERAGGKR